MCTADATHASGDAFGHAAGRSIRSAPDAVAMAAAAMDYLNSAVADLGGAACGELLIALGEVQAKLTAAHAAFLRRFDAADAHDADGFGTSSPGRAPMAKWPGRDRRPPARRFR